MLQKGIATERNCSLNLFQASQQPFSHTRKIGWRFLPLDEAMDKSTGLMIFDLMSL